MITTFDTSLNHKDWKQFLELLDFYNGNLKYSQSFEMKILLKQYLK